jgi:hypothetical protein
MHFALLHFYKVMAAGCSLLQVTRPLAACGCRWQSMLALAPHLWAMERLLAASVGAIAESCCSLHRQIGVWAAGQCLTGFDQV